MQKDIGRALRGIDVTLRAAAIGAILIIACWAIRDTLLLAFAAILLGSALAGVAGFLRRRSGIPYGSCLAAVILALLAVAVGLGWWRGPLVINQAGEVTDQLVGQVHQIWQSLQSRSWGQRLTGWLSGADNGIASTLAAWGMSSLDVLLNIVVIVSGGIFLAIAPDLYVRGAVRLLPPAWRPRGHQVMLRLGHTLRWWFLGQLIDMTMVATLIGTGLWLLGVKLVLPLALFAGLMNFVPYIGAIIGAVPAVLVALSQSPMLAVWTVVMFTMVQTIEGNLIAPLVQRQTVHLPPVLTIFAQLLLGTLFGLLGVILATPAMAALLTAVRMIYVETVLERRPPT